jgi:hypothetical protein
MSNSKDLSHMGDDGKSTRDDWLIPELERRYKKAWRVIIISAVLIAIMAACYLATLNIVFEWIALIPSAVAFFGLGYQDAMVKADDHIQDFASQVSLIIEARLAKDKKHESVKSR